MRDKIVQGWRPKVGQPVIGHEGCLGHVVKVVDRDDAWGGPWEAKIEYYYIEGVYVFPVHDWCLAQEWGHKWRSLREEERDKCKVVVNKYNNLAIE